MLGQVIQRHFRLELDEILEEAAKLIVTDQDTPAALQRAINRLAAHVHRLASNSNPAGPKRMSDVRRSVCSTAKPYLLPEQDVGPSQ